MNINNISNFFFHGMKRNLPELITQGEGIKLNLGCGTDKPEGYINLDLPDWKAEDGLANFDSESISEICAFHFFEHLKDPIAMLAECQRVLIPGGVLNICVPHCSSDIAFTDLTHQHYFSHSVWKHLFKQSFYAPPGAGSWKFDIGLNLIIGIQPWNMALLTQLVKQ